MHADWPRLEPKLPGLHCVHADVPTAPANLPEAQATQVSAAPPEYCPSGHGMQLLFCE